MERRTRNSWLVVLLWCLAFAGPSAAQIGEMVEREDEPYLLARLGGTPWFHHGVDTNTVSWSADGRTIISGHYDGTVRVWDVQHGLELRQLTGHKTRVSAALSPDGTLAASVGDDFDIRIHHLRSRKGVHSWSDDYQQVAVAFSPDGKTLASGDVGGHIYLWDVETGKQLHRIDAHKSTCEEIRFVPSGEEFASCGVDHRVCRWQTKSANLIEEFDPVSQSLSTLDYSPDGKLLAIGSMQGRVVIRDLDAKKSTRQFRFDEGAAVFALAFMDKGLAIGGTSSIGLQILDPETGKARSLNLGPKVVAVRGLAVCRQTNMLVAAGEFDDLRLFDLETLKRVERPAREHHGPVSYVGFSPDGKSLAWGGRESATLQIHSVPDGQRRLALEQPGGIASVRYSPDGKQIAVVTTDDLIHLVDASSGKAVEGFNDHRQGRHAGPGGVAFSGDGKDLLSIGPSGYFWHRLPRCGGGDVERTGIGMNVDADHLILSPDGTRLVRLGSDGGDFTLLSLPDRKQLAARDGCHDAEVAAAFSGDSRLLVTADMAGSIRVWNTRTSTQIGWWSLGSSMLEGRGPYSALEARLVCNAARTIAISPDGQTLAAWECEYQQPLTSPGWWIPTKGSPDIKLYEIRTQRLRATLSGHDRGVTCLAFSPDGRMLASGSNDETCILWDLTGRMTAGLPATAKLSEDGCHPLWNELSAELAATAWHASWALVAGGDTSVAFLRKRLESVTELSADRLAKTIGALDDDSFETRERASKTLALLGSRAETPLRKSLAKDPTPEVKRRVEQLLGLLESTPTGERLRHLRAIEVLEHIGTTDARRLLEKLAVGAADDAITLDAKASLERLGRNRSQSLP